MVTLQARHSSRFLTALVSLVVVGCSSGSATNSPAPTASVQPIPSVEASAAPSATSADPLAWFTTAADPYKGTELRVVGENTPPTEALAKLAPKFEELTGIKLTVEEYPFEDLMQKVNLDITSNQGTYDVASVPYTELGRLAGNDQAAPLTTCLNDPKLRYPNLDQADILQAMWELNSYYKDQVYGFPSNAAAMIFMYRKDLFDDPGEQAAFKAKFGYDLAVPTTWEHYSDIAQFFTRKQGETLAGKTLDKDFYGVAVAAKRHKAMVEEWLHYVWSWGGTVYTPDGVVMVDQQPVIDATNYFLSLLPYAPPGATDYTWDEVSTAIQQGLVAMAQQWSDYIPNLEDPSASAAAGKLGYALPPVKVKGADSFGGYTYLVPKSSKHPEAACLLMQWIASAPIDTALTQAGGSPIRASTFDLPDVAANPGATTVKAALNQVQAMPKTPQFAQINDAIAQRLSEAATKQSTVEQALTDLKADLENILK